MDRWNIIGPPMKPPHFALQGVSYRAWGTGHYLPTFVEIKIPEISDEVLAIEVNNLCIDQRWQYIGARLPVLPNSVGGLHGIGYDVQARFKSSGYIFRRVQQYFYRVQVLFVPDGNGKHAFSSQPYHRRSPCDQSGFWRNYTSNQSDF